MTLTVPAQLRSGDYRLRWTGVDHLGNAVGDEHLLALTGLEVGLDTQTDKPAYLSNETVSALGVITPSAPLEDAQLRLRVVSRGDNPYFGDYGEPGMVVTTVAGGVVDAPAAGKALRLDPDGIAFGPDRRLCAAGQRPGDPAGRYLRLVGPRRGRPQRHGQHARWTASGWRPALPPI